MIALTGRNKQPVFRPNNAVVRPLWGRQFYVGIVTQGVALGCYALPLQGKDSHAKASK